MTGGEDRCQVSDLSDSVGFSGKNGAFVRGWRAGSPRVVTGASLQLGVFRLGLPEDWDVGVSVFPKGKEILVGSPGLGLIPRHSVGSAEMQVGERTYGIGQNDSAMVENFL